jgi:hypothetical protein
MKEEVVLMLSELRSQIDDTISRVEKESAAEDKEIMSTLDNCEYIMLGSCIIFPQHVLDWCLSSGFLSTATEENSLFGGSYMIQRYVSRTDLIRVNGSDITVHSSLRSQSENIIFW